MAKQRRNKQKKWLLLLMRHHYIIIGISILLFSADAAVYPTRAFPGGYSLKIAQLPATTKLDANRALQEGLKLYQQGTADSLRQAIKKWEEALSLYRAAGDKKGEVTALFGIGRVYNDLGEKQKALEYYNQALPLYRAIGHRGGEATTLNNIGLVYNDLGEPQKTLEYFNQALPLFRAIADRRVEATILNNIGLVYSDLLEDKHKALEYYNQALPVFRAVTDRKGEATVLNNIGLAHSDLGEKHKAFSYYNQALLLHRAVGNKGKEAIVLNNIGKVYSDLGEEHKALSYYNQALPLFRAVADRKGEATIFNNIGVVYDDLLGDKHKALEYYKQALPLVRAIGNRVWEANTLNNIGGVYADLGDKRKALEYYNQASLLYRAVGDKGGEAYTLNNIGFVYYSLGDKRKALEYYNQALPLRRTVGDRAGEATTLKNIGAVYRDNKQMIEAIKHLEQSVSITLQLRSGIGRENRKTFLESERGGAIALIDLLINQNQPERAFEWANLANTADLAVYSRLVNAKVANPEAQKAIDQWNQKNIQLESLRKQLQQNFSPELSQQVNQLQERLNREGEDISRRFIEAADLFETQPTDITQLRASIPADTTVIQPVLLTNITNVPNTIALFVLTKDKLKVIKVPIDTAKFDSQLTQTYTSLTNRFDDKYIDNLEKLYNLLIRPVEAEIQATNPKKLSIIATGKLRYIPFEAFYDAKTDQYFIQKYPISYLTRLSTRSLQAKGTQTPASAKKVLAFGNPVIKPPLALPGAEAEVKSITGIFPGSEAFVNSKATLNTFKIQSPRFSLLHLATHGCFDSKGCCLPDSKDCRKPNKVDLLPNTILFADRQFNIADAALLGLENVELITLSACQTALETNSNGEEIAGLAYLFERAGSKAVIASLWSAEDSTTKAIMEQFYQNLKKGMSKDEALQQAKLSQIDSHPFFWSPFVIIGDER